MAPFFAMKRSCWGCGLEFDKRDLFELYEDRDSKDRRLACRPCAERILAEAVDAYEGALLAIEPWGGSWNEYLFMRPEELIENNWSEEFVAKLEQMLTGLAPTCARCGRPASTRVVDVWAYGGKGPFDGVLTAEDLQRDETLCGQCAVQSVFAVIDALDKPPRYLGVPLSNRYGIWTSSQA